MIQAKDLSQEAPRSPRCRLGGYVILARAIDKDRSSLLGKNSDYHFDCPLDNMLFGFKEVKGSEVYKLIEQNASDEEIVHWLNGHGASKTTQEIQAWSDSTEDYNPFFTPEKKEWFVGVCRELNLNPETTTLFDMLEKDDTESFQNPHFHAQCSL